ncbi:MAG: DNA repair protein RecN [Paracoccaceae bacterium]
MLRHLEIRDLLLIDHLSLEFQAGLNVLTGETGAGKSIILDALGFVLGWRGRADLVRQGAEQGEVSAVFDLPMDHPVQAILVEAGLPSGPELILRRINTQDGRKTAWVNDRRASGDVLRALSDVLVELHGQHDDRGLLDPRGHRALLDEFGGHGDDLAALSALWRARSKAASTHKAALDDLEKIRAEEDFLRHAVAEFESLAPVAGEEDALDAKRRLMQGAERLREDVARLVATLSDQGAEGQIGDALRLVAGLSDRSDGALDEALAALERANLELGEAQRVVGDFADRLIFNPQDLEETEDRLFALRALARKHGVLCDALPEMWQDLQTRLSAIEGGDAHLAALAAAEAAADQAYHAAAAALRSKREAAARALDTAMAGELAPLKMERAVFTTALTDAPAGPEGIDAVTFTVATNPGAPAGPLNKIASGGELSRFLLALKVCLTRQASDITMIFDEIDRGVGGATADAVGRRLAALAQRGQVLVVTHSPQVAALGAHHWRVSKAVENEITLSIVTPLDADARVDEIARMISGDVITDAAREAARALVFQAQL